MRFVNNRKERDYYISLKWEMSSLHRCIMCFKEDFDLMMKILTCVFDSWLLEKKNRTTFDNHETKLAEKIGY